MTDPISFISHPTDALRFLMESARERFEPEVFSETCEAVRSAFEKYTDALRAAQNSEVRALVLHKFLDELIRDTGGLGVSCRKGCAGCCHFEVEIFEWEADLLLRLTDLGVAVDWSRLKVQAARARKDPAWLEFFSPANRCVFLKEDSSCGIYMHRPAACRRLLVRNDPELCTTLGSSVDPLRFLLVEVVLSAARSLDGARWGSLSKMMMGGDGASSRADGF